MNKTEFCVQFTLVFVNLAPVTIFLCLEDFKKALEEEINTTCNILEESIVQTYEKHSKTIQDKLQELFAVLERISKL